jgi:hypothetical protein
LVYTLWVLASCLGSGTIRLLFLFKQKEFLHFHTEFALNLANLITTLEISDNKKEHFFRSLTRKWRFRLLFTVSTAIFVDAYMIYLNTSFGSSFLYKMMDNIHSILFTAHFFSPIILDYFVSVYGWYMELILEQLEFSQESKNNEQNLINQNNHHHHDFLKKIYNLLECFSKLEEQVAKNTR